MDITVDTGGRLVQDEKVEVGSIPMETYNTYIKAAGGYLLAIFVFSMFVINVVGTGMNYLKRRNLKVLNQLNPIFLIKLNFFLEAMSSWWLAHWLDVGVVVSKTRKLLI